MSTTPSLSLSFVSCSSLQPSEFTSASVTVAGQMSSKFETPSSSSSSWLSAHPFASAVSRTGVSGQTSRSSYTPSPSASSSLTNGQPSPPVPPSMPYWKGQASGFVPDGLSPKPSSSVSRCWVGSSGKSSAVFAHPSSSLSGHPGTGLVEVPNTKGQPSKTKPPL